MTKVICEAFDGSEYCEGCEHSIPHFEVQCVDHCFEVNRQVKCIPYPRIKILSIIEEKNDDVETLIQEAFKELKEIVGNGSEITDRMIKDVVYGKLKREFDTAREYLEN